MTLLDAFAEEYEWSVHLVHRCAAVTCAHAAVVRDDDKDGAVVHSCLLGGLNDGCNLSISTLQAAHLLLRAPAVAVTLGIGRVVDADRKFGLVLLQIVDVGIRDGLAARLCHWDVLVVCHRLVVNQVAVNLPLIECAEVVVGPNILTFRPCDVVETAEAWEIALQSEHTPSVLA